MSSGTYFLGKAIGFFIAFFILFVIPAILPIAAFLILAPVGFVQLFLFAVLAIVFYIIALVIFWFMISCFT